MDMQGRVALITGGSSGIGRAAAVAFARAGARVAIASRGEARGRAVAAAIAAEGGEAIWISADVARADDAARMVQRVGDEWGRLDYAFNNGGSGGRGGSAAELDEADWNATIAGYLTSVWLCMKYEIPALLAAGGGAIVNNASVDGHRAFPPDPAYAAAKHGVLGLTKSAALQYAQHGIRINAVSPGWIRTPLVEDTLAVPGTEQQLLLHQPIGRLGRPEEVAEAVLWLCSPRASLVLGVALPVDGGYTAV